MRFDSVGSAGGRCDKERVPFQGHFGTLGQFLAEEAEVGRLAHGVWIAVRLIPVATINECHGKTARHMECNIKNHNHKKQKTNDYRLGYFSVMNIRHLRLDEITESVVVRFQKFASELFVADTLDHAALLQLQVGLTQEPHLFLHAIGLAGHRVETGDVVVEAPAEILVDAGVEIEPIAEDLAFVLLQLNGSLRFADVQIQMGDVLQRPAQTIGQQDERFFHPFGDQNQFELVVQLLDPFPDNFRIFVKEFRRDSPVEGDLVATETAHPAPRFVVDDALVVPQHPDKSFQVLK